MDATTTAPTIAKPIGTIGSHFYFAKTSRPIAESIGLNVGLLYGAGRGLMVAGATSTADVEEAFYFFKPGFIAGLYDGGRAVASDDAIVAAHVESFTAYAEGHFASCDEATLVAFAEAARAVVANGAPGRFPLVDGYAALEVPASPAAAAYLAVILLRELRGGVHIVAVRTAGMAPQTACQLDGTDYSFPMHGWAEEDRVEATEEVLAARAAIEAETDALMGAELAHVSEAQRDALVAGIAAMEAGLAKA